MPIQIEVISKSGWGAAAIGELSSHVPERLTYHHTASGSADPAGARARIRGYQRYHMEQGWPDIAYHFIIDQAGRIFQGRPHEAPGDTFTEYDPNGHFLPCFDGNFDTAEPSAASIDALVSIMAWAVHVYGIDPANVAGHRDFASTTCPGDNLYVLKDEITARLQEVVASGQRFELRYVDDIALG